MDAQQSEPAAISVPAPILIHEYPQAVRGRLVKRYKRFLADILLQPPECDTDAHSVSAVRPVDVDVALAPAPTTPGAEGLQTRAGGRATAPLAPAAAECHREGDVSAISGTERDSAAAVTVHCPNTGPMTGLLDWPLAPVACSVSSAASRKYKHTLEMIQAEPGGAWVGVHSALANQLVHSLLLRRLLPQLGEWDELQREVPYGTNGSRVDFVLRRPTGRRVFLEVKSVTLAETYSSPAPAAATAPDAGGSNAGGAVAPASAGEIGGGGAGETAADSEARLRRIALFPDTVSDRAQRHVRDLMEVVHQGDEAACVFVIQRGDCDLFAPCVAKDPLYASLVRQAAVAGVQMLAVRVNLRPPRALSSLGTVAGAVEGPEAVAPVTETAKAGRARGKGRKGPASGVMAVTGVIATVDGGSCRSSAGVEFLGLAELVLGYGSTAGNDVDSVATSGVPAERTEGGSGIGRRRGAATGKKRSRAVEEAEDGTLAAARKRGCRKAKA